MRIIIGFIKLVISYDISHYVISVKKFILKSFIYGDKS